MKKLLLLSILLVSIVTTKAQTYSLWGPIGNTSGSFMSYYNTVTGTWTNNGSLTFGADYNYSIIQGTNGLLYGVSPFGGKYGYGNIISYSIISHTENVLIDFDSATTGSGAYSSLIQASNGLLYGINSYGGLYGQGTMFSYNIVTAQFTVVVNFDSANTSGPDGGLLQASNGIIYGTTSGTTLGSIGFLPNSGLFSYNPATGNDSVIINFTGTATGYSSTAGMVQDSTFIFFTTAYDSVSGGGFGGGFNILFYNYASGQVGAVFSSANDTTDGAIPISNLIMGKDGLIYGTTMTGGIYGQTTSGGFGTLFSYNPSTGQEVTRVYFDSTTTGEYVPALSMDTAGNVYGMAWEGGTSGYGTFFRYTPKDSTFKVLSNQDSTVDIGSVPVLLNTYMLSGKAFNDLNNNCTYSAGDANLKNIPVVITNNLTSDTNLVFTDTNGNYNAAALLGTTSTVGLNISNLGYTVHCPASGSYTDTATTTADNFALRCSNGFDLAGNLGICVDTPGFSSASIEACIYNNRCQAVNGQLKLILDTALHITNTVAASAPTISGDTLIWNLDSIALNSTQNLCVSLTGNISNIPAGDSVFATLIVTPITGDTVPANNTVTHWVKPFPYNCIGLPYDPNNKSVSPIGNVSSTRRLTYNIHFQNTGTAPAHNVVVMDTLSPNLDPTTLQIISSSAPMTVKINSGNILQFTFTNINLPDSATGKTNSIGSFTYSIKPRISTPVGSHIVNSAGIYFDANPVVLTNSTLNIIDSTVAPLSIAEVGSQPVNLACFPNPFTNTTSIVFNTSGKHYMEVDDITGRKIEWIECEGKQYQLSRDNLTAGIYIIKAFDADMKYSSYLKIVVQ